MFQFFLHLISITQNILFTKCVVIIIASVRRINRIPYVSAHQITHDFHLLSLFYKSASIYSMEIYRALRITHNFHDWSIRDPRLATRAFERGGRKGSPRESRRCSPARRRSNVPRNPSANGMQSNPFAESDLALVNRNRGKSARNNAAPRDRRNCRTNNSPVFERVSDSISNRSSPQISESENENDREATDRECF